MKHLYVQSNKSFDTGFVLTEQELRRINETLKEQMLKVNDDDDLELRFEYIVKYRNGVVAETEEFNAIFNEENEGQKAIVSIEILAYKSTKGQNDEEITNTLLAVSFNNIKSNVADTKNSVKYTVRGLDRDWVFVTSSLIEERLQKVKRALFFTDKLDYGHWLRLFLPLLFLIGMMWSLTHYTEQRQDSMTNVRELYNTGKVKNTDELILMIEEQRREEVGRVNFSNIIFLPFVAVCGLSLLGLLIYGYSAYLLPLYNFCWGDYQRVFQKKENIRKTVNISIFLALGISIVSGLITNFLTK